MMIPLQEVGESGRPAHARRRAVALLAAAWPRLPAALQWLWRQPDTRAAWTSRLAQVARGMLAADGWRIAHPPGWAEAERQAFAAGIAAPAEFSAGEDIEAGLRICRGGNCVDGTLQALLADRRAIEARLLARLGEHAQ